MRFFGARDYRALLLLLLLGLATASWHVSSHLLPDQPSCAFCGGHSDPGHAIVPAARLPDFAPAVELRYDLPTLLVLPPSHKLFYQRGPPVLA